MTAKRTHIATQIILINIKPLRYICKEFRTVLSAIDNHLMLLDNVGNNNRSSEATPEGGYSVTICIIYSLLLKFKF